jgi:hypothetical protein
MVLDENRGLAKISSFLCSESENALAITLSAYKSCEDNRETRSGADRY